MIICFTFPRTFIIDIAPYLLSLLNICQQTKYYFIMVLQLLELLEHSSIKLWFFVVSFEVDNIIVLIRPTIFDILLLELLLLMLCLLLDVNLGR
jgi:hypothetical protein